MPKQQERTLFDNNQQKEPEVIQLDEDELKRLKEKKKEQINAKLETTYRNAERYLEKYGEEDYRTQLMMLLLEISDYFLDVIDMIESFQEFDGLFNDVMGLFDISNEINEQYRQQQLAKDYGFFARRKKKKEIRKAQENNRQRIKMTLYNIQMSIESATTMAEEMKGMVEDIKHTMEATAQQKNKKNKKAGTAVSPSQSSMDVFNRYRAKYTGTDGGEAPKVRPQGGSTGAPKGGSGSDDINDVL